MKSFSFSLSSFAILSLSAHADLIYEEDFSSPNTFSQSPNPYIGGFFNSQLGFQRFVVSSSTGPSAQARITNDLSSEVLQVRNTSGNTSNPGHRGSAVVLDPQLFQGAGQYRLAYDIVSARADQQFPNPPTGPTVFANGDSANVRIWSGNGYDFGNTPNGIIVDTLSGNFRLPSNSGAIVSLLEEASNDSIGIDFTLDFNYDGASAIGIFLGASDNGFPFTSMSYDNIRVESLAAIPEVSGTAFLSLLIVSGLFSRRRAH